MKKTASCQKSSLNGLINCKLRFVTFEVEESECGSKVKGSAAAEAGNQGTKDWEHSSSCAVLKEFLKFCCGKWTMIACLDNLNRYSPKSKVKMRCCITACCVME